MIFVPIIYQKQEEGQEVGLLKRFHINIDCSK